MADNSRGPAGEVAGDHNEGTLFCPLRTPFRTPGTLSIPNKPPCPPPPPPPPPADFGSSDNNCVRLARRELHAYRLTPLSERQGTALEGVWRTRSWAPSEWVTLCE
jgi:hypothetical protein